MFQSNNTFRSEQHSAASMYDQFSVIVEMPERFEGKPVSSRAVMIALLWQEYGLDLLHPQFSRWLDRNAPDVKFEVMNNSVENGVNVGLRVGASGKVKVELPLEFDQRLREVSSQYLMGQKKPQLEQMKPERRQMKREPEQKEQKDQAAAIVYLNQTAARRETKFYELEQEDQAATIVYLNQPAANRRMNDDYQLAS